LTISALKGLVNQEEYFNKKIASRDVTNYYLICKGEFAYNKSYSKEYPVGAIKKLDKYDFGVVSTLYICFKCQQGYSNDYFEQFFESGVFMSN
jgi:type I restriction enzyme S subunit